MKKQALLKKLVSSILVAIIVLGQFSGYRLKSKAAVVTSGEGTLSLSLSKTNENGNGYAFGMEPDGSLGENIWSIVSSGSIHGSNLYCVKAQYSETWNTTGSPSDSVEYNKSYVLPLQAETAWNVADNVMLGKYTNEILWLIDNLYIPGESDEEDYIEYLNNAGITEKSGYYTYSPKSGHDYTFISSATDSFDETVTPEDIVAIQQMAIWYYTNFGANGNIYNDLLGTSSPWLQYTTDELLQTSTQYKDLENLSEARAIHATIIYNYLVNEAENVASSLGESEEYKLSKKSAKLWVSTAEDGTVYEEQPVIEVHKLEEKIFDLSLRKAIVSVGVQDANQEIEYKELNNIQGNKANREISILQDTLNTGTNATYKHRKDPIVVQEGDIVKYAITIYNEGETDGYAKQIVDQLPPATELALRSTEDVTSSTGNVYQVSISATDNKVQLTLKSDNPVAIPAYDGTTLSSENIEIECIVKSKPEQDNAKILTNIAYISQAHDLYTGKDITTNQIGEDRDSAPGAYPTYQGTENDDRQNGVTYWSATAQDYGYIGNSKNSTDLSSAETYYEGVQDDDDFEKIVIMPQKDITVTKIWDDKDNQDAKRPTNIKVQLYVDGVETGEQITLTAGDDGVWQEDELKHTWTNLPIYKEGKLITYTAKEISSSGTVVENNGAYDENYTATYSADTLTITNKYEPEVTEITVTKVWDDSNNQDGLRPTSIQLELYADGIATGEKVTLTAGDDGIWQEDELKYTWTELPKYNAGALVTYTVKEISVNNIAIENNGAYDENYTTTYSADTLTITNTHIPEVTEITVTKIWDDNNNQDGVRPTSIKVQLYADGVAIGEQVTLTAGDDGVWQEDELKHTWTELTKYKEGKLITYTVKEISSTNIVVENNSAYDENYRTIYSNDTLTITNKYETETTGRTVVKVWEDNNNQDGVRPTSIKVQLYADGVSIGEQVTLTAGDDGIWQEDELRHTWTELPKYKEGTLITYTVKEISSTNTVVENNGAYDENYTATYSENTFTITNTHIPEKIEITVNKVWSDNNNQDGIRPTSIKVQLYANGVETGEPATLTAGDDGIWQEDELKHTWTELPKYKEGNLITYTVKEISSTNTIVENNSAYDENYTATYSADTLTITNTHIPEVTEITVNKVWNDNNDQDGVRPTSIKVQLYADGVATGEQVALIAGDDGIWQEDELKYTWTELPKYKEGKLITYTVKEISSDNTNNTIVEDNGAYDEHYTATYSEDTLTITNTHIPEVTEITVNKVWDDNNNQDGVRPTSIQVQLYADGVEAGEPVTLTACEDGTWKHTWTELPKCKEGKIITYTVKEIPESGTAVENNGAYNENYTATYSEDTLTITNTHIPEETEVTVEKIWDDSNNQYGLRPNCIKIQLYADGEKQGETIELNALNNWKYTWQGLAKKENGKNIEYTVKEINDKDEVVENNQKYNQNYVTTYEQEENKTTITNSELTFDLKLIKFITEVNGKETENRVIKVDTSKLNTIDTETGKMITTAEYILEKDPVSVKGGDFVTYTLRIYNEGYYDGYATEISEEIPEGLEFLVVIEGADGKRVLSWDGTEQKDITEEIKASNIYEEIIETNSNWGYSQDSTVITTKGLSQDIIQGIMQENTQYADEQNQIDYKEISLIFRVKADVEPNEILRNEATISEDKVVDEQGQEVPVEDRDSLPGKTEETWKKENSDETYDEEGKWPIYKEDDEDYDNIITKSFDLSLRKQIIQINNGLYTQRFSELDTNDTYKNTLYDYYDVYNNKPKVKSGDIVTYSIRIYNEGEIDGYASLIVDTLPSGLEFYSSKYNGTDYGWTLVEGTQNIYKTDYLSYEKDTNKGTADSTIIKAYNGEGEVDFEEIFIVCKVKEDVTKEDKLLNVAQIAEDSDGNGNTINDRDSVTGTSDDETKWKQEDDLDIEILQLREFDLALRKFITQIENGKKVEEVTSRIPQVAYNEEIKQIKYTHTKDALVVHVGDIVIYTLRIYNEGDIDGYASEIKDNIPEYLEYLPEHNTNKEYEWAMYDKDGNKTDDVTKAVFITTEYLAKGNGPEKETENANLIEAFEPDSELSGQNPDYKEVKVAFKVKDPNSTKYEIVNFAQISEDTDSEGKAIKDKDSEPDNGESEPKEDDEDIEKVKVEYFDLSLLKYVTKVLVNENGQERTIETGNVGDENDIIPHVQINKKNVNNTVIKFAYTIKITNEGQIAGEATEITDYVPEGLVFVAEDNEYWTDEGNNVISTRQLTGSTLQPGESVEVEVILRWINGENNFGEKINVAEISEDYNEKDVPDIDSTPDNKKDGEDDIDEAVVLLSVNQGGGIQSIYINLTLIFLGIILVGGVLIKKFVL